MQHLRQFMKRFAQTMPAKITHHAISVFFGMMLDGVSDVAESGAGADGANTAPQTFAGGLAQAARQQRRFANIKHAAGVAMPAVFFDGNVNVENIAISQRPRKIGECRGKLGD